MTRSLPLIVAAALLVSAWGAATAAQAASNGKVCHMEQQCHWENFKKICVWVKVCR
jgi:Spy/CpxP family protein refolding chaperone